MADKETKPLLDYPIELRTLRDLFAGQAMAALVSLPLKSLLDTRSLLEQREGMEAETIEHHVAAYAYKIADAMLEERSKMKWVQEVVRSEYGSRSPRPVPYMKRGPNV